MLKNVSLNFQNTKLDFLFFCHDTGFDSDTKSVFHKHMNYEIHFALKGSYVYEFTDNKIVLQKNQMLIIPPGTIHRSVDVSNDAYDFTVLTMKISGDPKDDFYIFFSSVFENHSMKAFDVTETVLIDVISFRKSLDVSTYIGHIYLYNCAAKVLHSLCSMLIDHEYEFLPISDEHTEVTIENLVNDRSYSLSDIASAINYSPRQTERLIKKLYGKSLTAIREELNYENFKQKD